MCVGGTAGVATEVLTCCEARYDAVWRHAEAVLHVWQLAVECAAAPLECAGSAAVLVASTDSDVVAVAAACRRVRMAAATLPPPPEAVMMLSTPPPVAFAADGGAPGVRGRGRSHGLAKTFSARDGGQWTK